MEKLKFKHIAVAYDDNGSCIMLSKEKVVDNDEYVRLVNEYENNRLNELQRQQRVENKLTEIENRYALYTKEHFLVVFNYFKTKILLGELDEYDEEILGLDEKVLANEITIENALSKHEFLSNTFKKIYLAR